MNKFGKPSASGSSLVVGLGVELKFVLGEPPADGEVFCFRRCVGTELELPTDFTGVLGQPLVVLSTKARLHGAFVPIRLRRWS